MASTKSIPGDWRMRVAGSNVALTFSNTKRDIKKPVVQMELSKELAVLRLAVDDHCFISSSASTTYRSRVRRVITAVCCSIKRVVQSVVKYLLVVKDVGY